MEWTQPPNTLHINPSRSLAVALMDVAIVAVAAVRVCRVAVRLDLAGIWGLAVTGARSKLFLSSEKTKTMKFEKWNLRGHTHSRNLACNDIVEKTGNVVRFAHEYRGLDHIQRPS